MIRISEKCNSENSIPITDKYGKAKKLISKIVSIISNKGKSIVSDDEGKKHNCPISISAIIKRNPNSGLYISSRSQLINASFMSIDISGKINYNTISLTDGSVHKLSRINRRTAIRENKILKHVTLQGFLLRNKK